MAEVKIEIPQDEVDAIIRNKRKARDPKACYACHRRKVKCDRGLPCDSCVKRDHPQLCSYERPSKRRQLAINSRLSELDPAGHSDTPLHSPTTAIPDPSLSQSGEFVSVPREQWEKMTLDRRAMQETIHNLRQGTDTNIVPSEEKPDQGGHGSRLDDNEREGIHAPSGQMGTMHLGSRSVLAYMMGLDRTKSSQDATQTLLEENILPKFGLDNETATYPFIDLWSTDASAFDVSGLIKALPDDEHCLEFFGFYRNVACTIYPVVADPNAFEHALNTLLRNRALGIYVPSSQGYDKPYGVTLTWLALLFAVLASGSQSSDRPPKERELTSQVYICCSYQALRMTNFMTHPMLETIQSFSIICNVLSYNMNPGVAYILLGMATRMAFTLGLHTDSNRFSDSQQYLRRRTWWALAWQDSHFSMSYDRPSSTAFCGSEIPYKTTSTPGNRSYAESMFGVIKFTQELIRGRITKPCANLGWNAIKSYMEELARIVADGAPHLRDRASCVSKMQHLERLALKLHSSYIKSELCRPALKELPSSASFDSKLCTSTSHPHGGSPLERNRSPLSDSLPLQLRRDCILNLELTIDAYLELYSISDHASRSWIGIQRSISAAFLLGVTQESHHDQHIHSLLRNLEHVITERTKMEPEAFVDPNEMQSPVPGRPGAQWPTDVTSGAKSRGNSLTDATGLSTGLGKPTKPMVSSSPHWARSMAGSLKALGKMNAALASPRPGVLFRPPSTYIPSALNAGSGAAMNEFWSGQISQGNPALVMPATPESSESSGEWNFGNMGERAAEYVQPALWG